MLYADKIRKKRLTKENLHWCLTKVCTVVVGENINARKDKWREMQRSGKSWLSWWSNIDPTSFLQISIVLYVAIVPSFVYSVSFPFGLTMNILLADTSSLLIQMVLIKNLKCFSKVASCGCT